MTLEDNKNLENSGKIEQNKPVVEKKESFDDLEKTTEQEISRDTSEFKEMDGKVESIEKSVGLTNSDQVQEIKKEMNIQEDLKNLDDQADKLKKQTEQEIAWLKLENHTFDENNFYRIVDQKGFDDYQETGIVRSSPTGTDSKIVGKFDIGHRPTAFPSFDKGAPDLSYTRANEDNYIFESKIPMYKAGEKNPVTGISIKKRHWAYRPINQQTGDVIKQMTPDMIENVYKLGKEGDLYLKK